MKARPGITIPELAEAMGIKQNYLYRVMPGLAEEGKVTKSGRGWHCEGLPRDVTHSRAPLVDHGAPGRGQIRPSFVTASRSSRSSFTVASIFARAKSLISRPSTIDHSPFAHVHGKLEISPSSTS